MRTIRYYTIEPPQKGDTINVKIPKGAQLLTIMLVEGQVRLYAVIDPKAVDSVRHIRVVGTGRDIRDKEALAYLGSCAINEGDNCAPSAVSPLIYHFFEKLNP